MLLKKKEKKTTPLFPIFHHRWISTKWILSITNSAGLILASTRYCAQSRDEWIFFFFIIIIIIISIIIEKKNRASDTRALPGTTTTTSFLVLAVQFFIVSQCFSFSLSLILLSKKKKKTRFFHSRFLTTSIPHSLSLSLSKLVKPSFDSIKELSQSYAHQRRLPRYSNLHSLSLSLS